MRQIQRVVSLWFSPTGNTERLTRRVGETLARRLGAAWEGVDFTPPAARTVVRQFGPSDMLIAGFPTYAGKLPNKILPDIRNALRGDGTPSAAVVTFGNRSYDNALAELARLLTEQGLPPLGGAAFVCRHAFTDALAGDRPDREDLRQADAFADRLAGLLVSRPDREDLRQADAFADRLAGLLVSRPDGVSETAAKSGTQGTVSGRETETAFPVLTVPGDADAPYYVPRGLDGQPAAFLKARPRTDAARCTRCGLCAQACPMGSISSEDPARVEGVCIKCQACVRKCPEGAKYFDDPAFLSHARMLEQSFPERKENAFFFAR